MTDKARAMLFLRCELWGCVCSLMNAIRNGCSENEIQRQLGMLYQVYNEEYPDNDR